MESKVVRFSLARVRVGWKRARWDEAWRDRLPGCSVLRIAELLDSLEAQTIR